MGRQLIYSVEFGFPLDSNRSYLLQHESKNHSSAIDHPRDIEEKQYGAIIGPFDVNPIPNCHISPFMTQDKPNVPTRHVIVDLSWPKGISVNAGVDKNSYLGSEFALTFPTIDDFINELVQIGPGAHIYKIDISRGFWHLKIDPLDLDLLGLQWNDTYIDTVKDIIAIPGEKLRHITENVTEWLSKDQCTKHDLQSLLGQLLYVHKCVHPSRIFLNRMLELLQKIMMPGS